MKQSNPKRKHLTPAIVFLFLLNCTICYAQTYPIVGTDVTECYNNQDVIVCPSSPSDPFFGQYPGVNLPSYQANSNGTVTDIVTGLTWQKSPDQNGDNNGIIENADKLTWKQMQARIISMNAAS